MHHHDPHVAAHIALPSHPMFRRRFSRLCGGLLAALLCVATTHAQGAERSVMSPDATARHLDALVPTLLAEKQVASVSIARIERRRLVFATAYGEARPGVPATPSTLYNIASMTKPLSAEVVLRLATRGRLSLDEPMSRFWVDPDLRDEPRRRQLTPRLSLSHRTGFPNWRDGTLRFERDPGTTFGYSGEGFEYMARFVEKKTGTGLETWAQRLVFDPIGMRETAYTRKRWFADRMALPHDASGHPLTPQIATRAIASDDVYSTPRDYARFMRALMRRQRISPALAAERVRVQTDRRAELCPPLTDAGCAEEAGFGLGWETYRIGGHRYLMHTGMDAGTFTLGYFSPDTGVGTILFTNSSNGPQVVLPILDAIMASTSENGGTASDREFVAFLRRLAG